MGRFPYLTTALAAMLTLSGPAALADGGTCPPWECGSNGPALDGRRVALPDGLRIGGAPAGEFQKITTNGPALDGRRVATPDLAGLRIDHQRPPSDARAILPIDQHWPGSGQDPQVQQ